MKRILSSLFVVVLFSTAALSQNWAPEGAEWYFDFNSLSYTGYVKISYTGDTVINGTGCKILSKQQFVYDYTNDKYDTIFLGREYMYSGGDKVYLYKRQSFYTLYDFGATAGDTWEIPALFDNACDSTGKVIVDSTSTIVINDETLRVIYCSAYEDSHWTLGHKIIEKIGSVDSYMLPEVTGNCGVADLFEGGALRCYSDNGFELYSTGIAQSCDFVTGIDNYVQSTPSVSVYPNPAKEYAVFELQGEVSAGTVSIINIFGKTVATGTITGGETAIRFPGLESGIYFYRVEAGDKAFSGKFVVRK